VGPVCRQCGEPYPELEPGADFVCAHCAERTWSFQWARAGFHTEGQVLEAIIGFKYGEEFYRLRQLTDWLEIAFDRHAAGQVWDGLVPVPLYHRRRRTRGFNQAYELARSLDRRRNIPVCDCLYRYRETPSQTGLARNKRFDNMAGAFALKPKFDVRGRNLLLIDDVCTTGATTNACAQALARAGSGLLAVLTISKS